MSPAAYFNVLTIFGRCYLYSNLVTLYGPLGVVFSFSSHCPSLTSWPPYFVCVFVCFLYAVPPGTSPARYLPFSLHAVLTYFQRIKGMKTTKKHHLLFVSHFCCFIKNREILGKHLQAHTYQLALMKKISKCIISPIKWPTNRTRQMCTMLHTSIE